MKIRGWACAFVGAVVLSCLAPACGSGGSGSGGGSTTNAGGGGGSAGGTNAGGASAGGSNAGGGAGSSNGGSSNGGSNAGGASAGQKPVVHITSPHDGDSFAINAEFPFTGDATDPQDGALTGTSLIWVGDINTIANPEGEGVSGDANFDSTGDHTLTLTATDSDGNTGSQTITLHIK